MTMPARRAVRYAKRNRAPAALLLFGVVMALSALRRGQLPNKQRAGALFVAALIVVLAAGVVPDLVVAVLGALLIVMALDQTETITRLAGSLLGLLDERAGGVGAGGSVVRRPV